MSTKGPHETPAAIGWEPAISSALKGTDDIRGHLRLGEVIRNIKEQKPELQERKDVEIANLLAQQLNALTNTKTKDKLTIALKNWEHLSQIDPEAQKTVAVAEEQFRKTSLPKFLKELGTTFNALLKRMNTQPKVVIDKVKSLEATVTRLISDIYTLPGFLGEKPKKLQVAQKSELTKTFDVEVRGLPEPYKQEIEKIKRAVFNLLENQGRLP